MKNLLKKHKSRLRDVVGEVLHRTGWSSPQRWAKDKLTIVTFHRVLPEALLHEYPIPEIAVTPEELKHFLRVFGAHYQLGTLADMARLHRAGGVHAKPLMAVTFDDGQLDNHEHALPVLRDCGVGASFFVVTDAIENNEALWPDRMAFAIRQAQQHQRGAYHEWLRSLGLDPQFDDSCHTALEAAKKLALPELRERLQALEHHTGGQVRPAWDGMMKWEHLKRLQAEGHEIGSHSVSHPILPLLPDAEVRREVAMSKDLIERKLGQPVLSFCYPNGSLDARALRAVRDAGYLNAVSTRYGLNGRDADPYCLQRIDLQGRYGRNTAGAFTQGPLMLRTSGLLRGMG